MRAWWPLLVIGVVGCALPAAKPEGAPSLESRAMGAPRASEPVDAEYAVRWDVAEGGPKTAEKALLALDLEPRKDKDTGKLKEKKLEIEYFDAGKPAESVKKILRLRTEKKEWELTLKLRGDKAIIPPACPTDMEVKDPEVDVTFTAATETRSAYSYSCEKEFAERPKDLPPRVGCLATLRRLEAKFASGELKVEEWAIEGARYIEVSFGGKNDATDKRMFGEKVVAVLVEKGIRPLENGMTTITTSCVPTKKSDRGRVREPGVSGAQLARYAQPPSILMTAPLVYDDASDAR